MISASDRKDVRSAEKASALAERQRGEVVIATMATTAGRRYMLGQLERCHIFHTSMSPDPMQTAFNEGERNIGLQLLNDIMAYCPDQWVVMMQERNAQELLNARRSAEHVRSEDDNGGDQGSIDPDDGPDTDLGSDIYDNRPVAA